MAEHPNVELTRRGYRAFSEGDMTLTELIADDCVWHVGGNNVLTGDHKGREAIFGYRAPPRRVHEDFSRSHTHSLPGCPPMSAHMRFRGKWHPALILAFGAARALAVSQPEVPARGSVAPWPIAATHPVTATSSTRRKLGET
jgi:hypothetical protein